MITTINKAASYFKQLDPYTAISASAIRRGIAAGSIPHSKVGNRYLVSVEKIEAYFSGTLEQPHENVHTAIRQVD